ncbi:MAG: ABC transporter permease subunit, partial [Acidimicrobiales bacterium]
MKMQRWNQGRNQVRTRAQEARQSARRARAKVPDVVGPLARYWAGLPRWARFVGYVVLIVLAILAPSDAVGRIMAPASDWRSILFYPIGVYVLLAIGLNVVVGQAGLLDLGYVAFFAIGSYAMALLGVSAGLNFWEILPLGIGFAALAGVILGAPTLRLRGDYLAIVTLGFGEIIREVANNVN